MFEHLLEEKYTFLRKLKTPPDLYAVYEDIDNRIGRIRPHQTIRTLSCPPLECVDDENITFDTQVFPNDNTKGWIKRIRFPEQLLACEKIWIVTHNYVETHFRMNHSAVRSEIDIQEISNPVLHYTGSVLTNAHSLPREVEVYASVEMRSHDVGLFSGDANANPARMISVQQINIVPTNRVELTAAFYDRVIANLYAESLERYLQLLSNRRTM